MFLLNNLQQKLLQLFNITQDETSPPINITSININITSSPINITSINITSPPINQIAFALNSKKKIILGNATVDCYSLYKPPSVYIQSATGTGKTIAFILPILYSISSSSILHALILVPTTDLAIQIQSQFSLFNHDLIISILSPINNFTSESTSILKSNIIISTPSRLLLHLSKNPLLLSSLRFLILDEVDALLSHNYKHWLSSVFQSINYNHSTINPPISLSNDHWANLGFNTFHNIPIPTFSPSNHHCQTILVSATLLTNPDKLADLHLYNTIYISNSEFILPTTLSEKYITSEFKILVLIYLLFQLKLEKCLIFVKTIEAAKRLDKLINLISLKLQSSDKNSIENFDSIDELDLNITNETNLDLNPDLNIELDSNDYFIHEETIENDTNYDPNAVVLNSSEISVNSTYISSDLNIQNRMAAIKLFKNSSVHLISTDVCARGIDISCIRHVINFDLPKDVDTYVHRVGRTARVGKSGSAWTILEKKEVKWFKESIGRIPRGERELDKFPVIESEMDSWRGICQDALYEMKKSQQ